MTNSHSNIIYSEGTIDGLFIQPLTRFDDQRGWLMELFRHDELAQEFHPVMAYMSQTNPGIVRGPHEHREQADVFAFLGPGDFRLSTWDARTESTTYGKFFSTLLGASNPATAIIPPGIVHAYQNISAVPGFVLNFPNRLYRGEGKRDPVDEIRHEDDTNSPFRIEHTRSPLRKAV